MHNDNPFLIPGKPQEPILGPQPEPGLMAPELSAPVTTNSPLGNESPAPGPVKPEVFEPAPMAAGRPRSERSLVDQAFVYPARTSDDDINRMSQEMLAKVSGPATLEDFQAAWRQAQGAKSMEQAWSELRRVAVRLPVEERAMLPDIVGGDVDMGEVWAYAQTHPEAQDLLLHPAFLKLFGSRMKKINMLEKCWFNLPLGAFYLGMKRGRLNNQAGRLARYNLGNWSDPTFQAKMARLEQDRGDLYEYLDQLDNLSGSGMDALRKLGVNAGDAVGGMGDAALSPEALVTAATGTGLGALTGVGTLPAAVGSLLTGASVEQGFNAAAFNAWQSYQAQPDDMKDEAIATRYYLAEGLLNFVLERLGSGAMVHGLGQITRQGFKAALTTTVPGAAARVEALMASPTAQGVATRFAARGLEHTVPEVLTEAIQEGPLETGTRILAANRYNETYGRKGWTMPVPTLKDMIDASWAAAKQTAWGGAGIGLVSPGLQAWQESRAIQNLSPEKIDTLNDTTMAAVNARLDIQMMERANTDLRVNVKQLAEILRSDPTFSEQPDITSGIMERLGGQRRAYVNAEALETMFQSNLENHQVTLEEIETNFLAPLGVTPENFREALETGTDVEIDLAGLPHVLDNPLWEGTADLLSVEPKSVTEDARAELADLEAALAELGASPAILEQAGSDVAQGTRAELEQRLLAAGRAPRQARLETEILARQASVLSRITGADPNAFIRDRISLGRGEVVGGSLNQAAAFAPATDPRVVFRTGMKALPPVEVLDLESTGKKLTRSQGLEAANQHRGKQVEIADIGGKATITRNGIADGLSHDASLEALSLYAALPELISRAQWVRRDPDVSTTGKKAREIVQAYAPVRVNGQEFLARITLKRWGDDLYEYYGHVLEWVEERIEQSEESNRQNSAPEPVETGGALSDMADSSSKKIIDLLEKVKRRTRLPEDLSPLYQSSDSPRGWTDFLADGGYGVIFTRAADASTAIHEFQHVFIKEALRILSLPQDQIVDTAAFNTLKEDIARLAAWAGAKDGVWTREAHEKAARAFEAYLMEGRAPVKGLRRLFGQMKKWLLNIYQNLRGLDVTLTDDVRQFFDRQLATEEELSLETWRTTPVIDAEVLAANGTPELIAEYEAARQKATEEAEAEITRFRVAERERLTEQWRREGQLQAKNDPRQMRLNEIKAAGGINRASLTAGGYDAQTVKALHAIRPGLVSEKGQLGFDEFAAQYGLDDGDSFIQALLSTPTQAELAAAYVADQEAMFNDYFNSENILTDAEIDFWELESRILAKMMADPGSKYAPKSWRDIKRIIADKTGLKTVDEISRQNMADLKASLKAQSRAAREAYNAGAKEARAETRAIAREQAHKNRAALLARAAEKRLAIAARFKVLAERQRELARFEAKAKRLIKQKTAGPDHPGGILPAYHRQIKNLLARAGLGKAVLVETSLADFVARLDADGAPVAVADWLVNGAWPVWEKGSRAGTNKSWRSLSYEQFQDLKNAVDNLVFLGRRQQLVNVGGRLTAEDKAANALLAGISAIHEIKAAKSQGQLLAESGQNAGLARGLLDAAGGYMASVIKVETMARRLDGGEIDGIAQKLIYKPVDLAWQKSLKLTEELIGGKLQAIVDQHIGQKTMLKWRSEKVIIPGLTQVLTREQVITAALNAGNTQNMRALRNYRLGEDGALLTTDQWQAVFDSLSEGEWHFVQAVWDFLDHDMFPLLNDLTLRTKGIPLAKVEAAPVRTKYGEFRGGYFPLSFDPRMSERGERYNDGPATGETGTLHGNPNTTAKSTIERSGRSYKDLVPRLSFDVLTRSLTDNIHDLTHREAVNDVWRVIRRPEVRAAIDGVLGEKYWINIKRWLQEVARPEQVGDAGARKLLRTLRGNISASAMALKASVALCQVTGITQSIHKLGTYWTAQGLAAYYGHPTKLKMITDEMYAKSIELKRRNQGSYDRDIHDLLTTHNPLVKTFREHMTQKGFWAIAKLDQAVANPVWLGAYLKATKALGKTEEEAIYYADTMVRITQPTGATKDLSRAQRGWGLGDGGKLLTMFQTFFNGTQNLIWEQFHETKGDFKTGHYLRGAYRSGRAGLLMAVLPALLEHLIKDGPPDDEDDLSSIGKGIISYTTGGMPVVKDAVSYLIGDSYGFRPVPAVEGMTAVLNMPEGVADLVRGEGWKGAKKIVRGLGPLTGLPTGQAGVTMRGVEQWDGDEAAKSFYRLLVRRPNE